MKLIVAVDDNMGMLFNKRRQSRDILLRKRILEIVGEKELFMNEYTFKQFKEEVIPNIVVSENPMGMLDSDGYCFVENLDVLQYESNFDKIIIYSWNRVYPKDLTFNIDLNNWECVSEFDFVGNSHDNITERVYIRKEKKDEE